MNSAEMKVVRVAGDVIVTSEIEAKDVGGNLFNRAFYSNMSTLDNIWADFYTYHNTDFAKGYPIVPNRAELSNQALSEANNNSEKVGYPSMAHNYLISLTGEDYIPVTDIKLDSDIKLLGIEYDAYNGYYQLVKVEKSNYYFDFIGNLVRPTV